LKGAVDIGRHSYGTFKTETGMEGLCRLPGGTALIQINIAGRNYSFYHSVGRIGCNGAANGRWG
jgi:hypothetical protein